MEFKHNVYPTEFHACFPKTIMLHKNRNSCSSLFTFNLIQSTSIEIDTLHSQICISNWQEEDIQEKMSIDILVVTWVI
jgi:hypothetical protein